MILDILLFLELLLLLVMLWMWERIVLLLWLMMLLLSMGFEHLLGGGIGAEASLPPEKDYWYNRGEDIHVLTLVLCGVRNDSTPISLAFHPFRPPWGGVYEGADPLSFVLNTLYFVLIPHS